MAEFAWTQISFSKRKNTGSIRSAWRAAMRRRIPTAFLEGNEHAPVSLYSGALSMTAIWPWAILVGLGAFHGVNPAMGWLFALCLGLQERRRTAVLAALPPIALGHAFSVGLVIALVAALRVTVEPGVLKY